MSHAPSKTPSRAVREQLGHPVIDADGHFVEFTPALATWLRAEGVDDLAKLFTRVGVGLGTPALDRMSPEERAQVRAVRAPWWPVPAANTLDLATAMLPELLHARLDDLGIDFAVTYPTAGLVFPHVQDETLRRGACRALNRYSAEIFAACAERMAPVGVVPLHSPGEGIEELEFAVMELGLKAVMIGCEADDPMTATAFDRSRIPFGTPLHAMFSSDIGHWDVADMTEVLAEAWEQVERGWLGHADFRDFVFGNAARFYTDSNPSFFRGTQKAVEAELSA